MRHYRKMPYPALIKEHTELVRFLSKQKTPAGKRFYNAQKKELKEYKQDYNKIRRRV